MATDAKIAGRSGPNEELLLRYAAIVESTDDAIIGKTLSGIITDWNHGAERIFGYKAREVIGKSILILFPPDRMEEEMHILGRIGKGERIESYETVRIRKDGRNIDVSVTISPIRDFSGRIIGASKIARDITEKKLLQESVLEAERHFRETLDRMLEGCQIIGYDWRYLYINDAAASHGRHSRKALLGRTMMEVYPGIEKTEMFSVLRRCMEERVAQRMENRFDYGDGTVAWFTLSMEPVPEGTFILSIEITNEKKLQEELEKHRDNLQELVKQRTAQLEEANRELESFSYSVSHDLRAPLRHINGFVELLNKRLPSSTDTECLRNLQIISSASGEMAHLIDKLLDFSRVSRVGLNKSKVNTDALVREVISGMAEEIRDRSIEWQIDKLPDVFADQAMLRQVFINLLSNALKFSGTRVKAKVRVGCCREKNEDVFVVEDNGVGFDMKYANKLFGVFQRLHGSDDFEGTGVGLANVRRIVERHGGRTWAEGKVNEGAGFYFAIPHLPEEGG